MHRGVAPIAGLVHHGSGPAWMPITHGDFPEHLAEYAASAARRYPFIRDWTPVNEPVTTARFCGLYGHWFPHQRRDESFVRILLTECCATALAMRAIRVEVPDARLIYTDDGGTVFSTERLDDQVVFENHRRDLALDLLTGRVDGGHPLGEYLMRHGASARELQWFRDHPTPPDVIGIDYYATSDRWLDDRVERYPAAVAGGNGVDTYADVAASHHAPDWRPGFREALQRLHGKYGRPVALTEVHLGCTREEQLRWLGEAWRGACDASQAGAAVEAVTAWALLGAHDWDSLVTSERGFYESGAFDIRAPAPRPTALAHAVRELATAGAITHPVMAGAGWWSQPQGEPHPVRSKAGRDRILILGARGTLGSAFVSHCEGRGLAYVALSRDDVDIVDAMAVRRAVAACRPWAVVNATGYVHVDDAETDRERCMAVNTAGAMNAGDACARSDAKLLTFSSDLVFDGMTSTPYREHDAPHPLNVYGATKHAAECGLLESGSNALIVRTSAFFGPRDDANFVTRTLQALSLGQSVHAPAVTVSPTYVPALVDAALDLLVDGESGVWHLSNRDAVTWVELARRVASLGGYDERSVEECVVSAAGWRATRPMYSALASARGWIMPTLERSLEDYMDERRRHIAMVG